jgi:hypothetical protein
MARRVQYTDIGRYGMEVITGCLMFYASRTKGVVHVEDDEVQIEMDQEETLELMRLLRSVPYPPIEVRPPSKKKG